MLAPTYPDHPWWSAIVDQAGGAIIGTIANGSRGIVVEDIVASKVYTMDITTTSPTPSEMPQRKPNCGKWIAATPYLIHRQDRENCGKTILHTICESNEPGSLEALESYLNNVQRVAPIVDERGQTPLDVALDNNEYAHCKILLDAYIKNNISALVSLKKPLCLLALRYPDLMASFLKEAVHTVESDHIRLSLGDRGVLMCSQNVASPWNSIKEEDIVDSQQMLINVRRPVEAQIMGFPGFISADGPFFSVVKSGHLEIFDTQAMRLAIRYKWETYGFYMYTLQSGIYFGMTTAFTMISLAANSNRHNFDEFKAGGSMYYLINALCVTVSVVFLAVEFREMIDDGWRTYWSDFQNYLHLFGCIGIWFPVMNWVLWSEIRPEIDALTIIANWLNMLGYLKGFKLTGSLVRMLIAVILDMRGFVLLVAMLIMGFAAALSLMLSHEDGFDMRTAPFTVFNMMLGNIEMHWFDDPHGTIPNETLVTNNGDATTGTRVTYIAAVADTVFVLFNALIVIIMLNLLIAILGNTYSRIAQHEKVQMEFERARCIYEIERHFLPSFVLRYNKFFPRFLHSLKPAAAKGVNEDTMEIRIREQMTEEIDDLKTEVDALREHMNAQVSRLILLLEPGTRIKRFDHAHSVRAVHLHLWGRTFPGSKWRCSSCMQDFDFLDNKVHETHELCFVCENHYPQQNQKWHPPQSCSFSLCAQCVRNEVGMSQKKLDIMASQIEEDEDELLESGNESEDYEDTDEDTSDDEYDDEDYED